MVNPNYEPFHEECLGDGILSVECAQLMQKDCAGATGQFWDNPACTVTGPGCELSPHSALLDPRSNCSLWNLELTLDAVDRWQKRNECVVSVTESITQKCKIDCASSWDPKNWKGRGTGFAN